MAISQTLRFLLKQYGSGGDSHPNRAEFNAMIDALENNAAMFSQGITGARPAAGKRGRFYWDETVDRLFYDNGTAWKDANPNGGGGAGLALAIGSAGSEGTSGRAARADHTHPLPLATAAAPGAMSAADKTKLDAATETVTSNAIARRDVNGRLSVATPTLGVHATTKAYVDDLANQIAGYADVRADGISLVCTSITRPPHDPGRRIYETDTNITRYSDGAKWQAIHMPYRPYSPQWFGFQNLGGGFSTGGEWSIVGPDTVRASAFLIAGDGAMMGVDRLRFGLPIAVATGGSIQFGEGAHIRDSIIGPQARVMCAAVSGASDAEIWVAPQTGGYETYRTPGNSGYPWGKGCIFQMQIVYKAALAI